MPAHRLLVTGLSGLIGGALRKHLGEGYTLRALNRRAVPGVECHRADLGDLDAIQPAFEDIDTVVHLGAAVGDDNAPADIMRCNVAGTYHVFEAARRAGVTRVVFASSGATIAGWERDPPLSHVVNARYEEAGSWSPLTHEAPLRPGGLYGASKVWGEAPKYRLNARENVSRSILEIGASSTRSLRPKITQRRSAFLNECNPPCCSKYLSRSRSGTGSISFAV